MTSRYSFVGPDVFMDGKGKLYKKASETFFPIKDKYIHAEDRYVKKQLMKGRDWNEKTTR